MATASPLTDIARAGFARDGYVVIPGLVDDAACAEMRALAKAHLAATLAPVEFETDVRYPGAPADRQAEGGNTVRRLLSACTRSPVYRQWATSDAIRLSLTKLFGSDDIVLSQCHHNCVMTKVPGYSSATSWHQDNRYWSFDREDLVSVWLALDNEYGENGCLYVLPGTHKMHIEPGRFDASLFLRPDLPDNEQLIATARPVQLERGDVLFFHSRLFHAAGQNLSRDTKFSVVFTYHEASNRPIEGTRSARFPGIPL